MCVAFVWCVCVVCVGIDLHVKIAHLNYERLRSSIEVFLVLTSSIFYWLMSS